MLYGCGLLQRSSLSGGTCQWTRITLNMLAKWLCYQSLFLCIPNVKGLCRGVQCGKRLTAGVIQINCCNSSQRPLFLSHSLHFNEILSYLSCTRFHRFGSCHPSQPQQTCRQLQSCPHCFSERL